MCTCTAAVVYVHMTAKRICTGPVCDRVSRRSNGLCNAHHMQWLRGVDLKPLTAKRRNGASLDRDEQGRKQCIRCSAWHQESAFGKGRPAGDGLHPWCRRCAHLAQYNILPQTYDAMLTAQGGVCATCGCDPAEGKPLQVDHDHACCKGPSRSCGKCIRGLLCFGCNTALGGVGDNPATLRALIAYLEAASDD